MMLRECKPGVFPMEARMILMRYRHRLPADYDLERIRDRVAARGSRFDAVPGLVFKAFTLEDRGRGATVNAYSSLYLWRDPEAAADFFAGPGFAAVVGSFGRPRVETWLVFDLQFGRATGARSLAMTGRDLAEEADLATERNKEADAGRAVSGEADVLVSVSGLDTRDWRLTRFTLTDDGSGPADILHLSSPGLAALRASTLSGV